MRTKSENYEQWRTIMKRVVQTLALKQVVSSLLLSLFAFIAFAQQVAKVLPAGITAEEQRAVDQLDSNTIREVTTILTSKEMEGRGTGQPGGDRAAKYLATRFADLGLRPGGDANTYLQTIKFIFEQASPESSFKAADMTFKYREEFMVPINWARESKEVSGKPVFVGYGVVSEELNHDDLRGVDIKGKIVIVLGGKPTKIAGDTWLKSTSGLPFAAL